MDTSPVKLPTHKHPLHRSSRFIHDEFCDGCLKKGPINEGYRCNDSECSHVWFHKDCAESSTLVNNFLHRQHPLILTSQLTEVKSVIGTRKPACDLCGKFLRPHGRGVHSTTCYHCSTCDFKLDLECGRKLPLLNIKHPMFHDHPLVVDSKPGRDHMFSDMSLFMAPGAQKAYCGVCKVDTMDNLSYKCLICKMNFHEECVNLAPEVNHLYHSNHPLMPIKSESLSASLVKTCVLCGAESEVLLYHCSTCNFSLCLFCTKSPPNLAIEHRKTHQHKLFLMPSRISFMCNVCGMKGNQTPYLCLQCGFSVHRGCVDLPRVININRHDHRISLIHQLGPVYSSCGVCHGSIDRYYGGYTCSVCPNYAVHSQCAVRNDIWEGIELENIPEEIEDVAPFIVVGDDLIKHFSHEEHNLRFNNNAIFHDENTRCKACVRPIYADPNYKCEQCDFILHIRCANLPRKKRLVYSNKPFTLVATNVYYGNHFWCSSCGIISNGFRYVFGDLELDIFCGSFSEPFMHDGHMHPLYYNTKDDHMLKCSACLEEIRGKELHCDTCEFSLHFRCANMPISLKTRFDDHPLFLCYGEKKASGKYWCDICEKETDPAKWFYTCSDCGVTLHVECVLGDFSHLMPGCIIKRSEVKYEVVSNNQSLCRPLCVICKLRCRFLNILRVGDKYVCSRNCLAVEYCSQRLNAARARADMSKLKSVA